MYALFVSAALAATPPTVPTIDPAPAELGPATLPSWTVKNPVENGRVLGQSGRYLLLGGLASFGAGMALVVVNCDTCPTSGTILLGVGASAGAIGTCLALAGPLVTAHGLRELGVPVPTHTGAAAVVLVGVALSAGAVATLAPNAGVELGAVAAGSLVASWFLAGVQTGENLRAEPRVTLAPTGNGLLLAGRF